MKRVSLLGVLLACALAACGGGGGGGSTPALPILSPTATPKATASPTPSPTPTPTPAAARVQWTITDAQGGRTVAARRANTTGFTQSSVMAITCSGSECGSVNIDNNPAVAPVDATPSPSPGASPAPAATPVFTTTIPGGGLAPLPAGDYSLGYGIVAANTTWTVNANAAPGLYSVTATYPNGDTGSVPVAAYATFQIASGWSAPSPQASLTAGYNFATNTATNDTTQADVYWTSDGVLHFPYGAVLLPFSTPIGSVSTSQWSSSAVTSVDRGTTLPMIILFKTASGSFVKVFPYDVAQLGPYWIAGAYSVATPPSDFPY